MKKNNFNLFLLLSLLFILYSPNGFAERTRPGSSGGSHKASLNLPLYLDISAHWGLAQGYQGGTSLSPTLMQWQLGATATLLLTKFLYVGATTDFRLIGQYSDVNASVGNLRGTRWNAISPTLILCLHKFTLKLDYQFFGDYKLSNVSSAGGNITYQGPLGWRAILLYQIGKKFRLGAQGEIIKFNKRSSSISGISDLSPEFTLRQIGITIDYVI